MIECNQMTVKIRTSYANITHKEKGKKIQFHCNKLLQNTIITFKLQMSEQE